jgi:hypothetical protein
MSAFKIIGDWAKTFSFFQRASNLDTIDEVLSQYAERGVYTLQEYTPKDSGDTSHSWGYEIEKKAGKTTIYWTNSNINKGVNIAIILQYGHGTRNGGYVEGIDYINPALKPVFQEMADTMWKELTK